MGMSGRLLRPRSAFHPEAAAWKSAVIANGGSVSGSTFAAVNAFCKAIDAAGIRDRFYRLNLFCGTSDASLNAVRTPLYRGPSRTGTQYGNAMDTNANFVAGDYSEATGLKGNTSSKYLATGVKPADIGGPLHLAVSVSSDLGNNEHTLGCDNFPDASFQSVTLDTATASSAVRSRFQLAASQAPRDDANSIVVGGNYRIVGSCARTLSATSTLYRNGSSVVTAGGTFNTYPDFALFVFGSSRKGTLTNPTGARLSSYSFGLDMTGTQVAAYNTALVAFLTALGRPTT
jgi:hypothetical protein